MKISNIVKNKGRWNAKTNNDVLLNELHYHLIFDFLKQYNFNKTHKVIHSKKDILPLLG